MVGPSRHLWPVFMMLHGYAAGLMRQVQFTQYASAEINFPDIVQLVRSLQECAALCRIQLVCSAFAINNGAQTGELQCSIALGSFTWRADPNKALFMEDIGQSTGYTFATDGRFYKLHMLAAPMLTAQQSRERCRSEGGDLAVDYPKTRRDAIASVTAPLTSSPRYHVGIGLTSSNTWTTDDGLTFKVNKTTPDQIWHSTQPEGVGQYCMIKAAAGWFDTLCTTTAEQALCRKDTTYRRGAANSTKYYKLHYSKVNATTAAGMCASEGGTLANWYNPADWSAISGYRIQHNELTSNLSNAFFVGGSDRLTEGTWLLPDGTTFMVADRATDTNQRWITEGTAGFSNEPDGGVNSPNLIFTAGGLADTDDATEARFLCEINL